MSAIKLLVIIIIALWTIGWKIYGVWLAAKHNHKKWFVAMLILNTAGILELIYVFYILKKSVAEVKKAIKEAFDTVFK